MICRRCGEEVPTVHAHKYGLNGYRCQPPPTKKSKRSTPAPNGSSWPADYSDYSAADYALDQQDER